MANIRDKYMISRYYKSGTYIIKKRFFMKKEMVIGIPRGMSFYNNYPFWYGFFTSLGIKIVLSDPTTKQTMSDGSALVVTETCLPIKIYLGHILNLISKGVKDIFVPSLQSVAPKIYNCSKIRGLPDLVRNVIKADINIIEPTLDKSAKNGGLYTFLEEAVRPFGITKVEDIKAASKQGWKVYNNFLVMVRSGMSYKKAMNYALQGKVFIESNSNSAPINVALVSHGYNIYDDRACMKIFEKLEKITSINLFEPVQGADNLFRRWCLHNLDNFFSSDTLGQNQEAFSIRRHTFDRIHFPMAEVFAIGYNFRAKFNRCAFRAALGLLNALALFPAVSPTVWQILQF